MVSIFLPPLKERKEDIFPLCSHFIKELNKKYKRSISGLADKARDKVEKYGWPGNVRELKNVIERAVIFTSGQQIIEAQIQFSGTAGPPSEVSRKTYRRIHPNREEIITLFKTHEGEAKKVARALKIAPRTLYYHIKRLGLTVKDFRS